MQRRHHYMKASGRSAARYRTAGGPTLAAVSRPDTDTQTYRAPYSHHSYFHHCFALDAHPKHPVRVSQIRRNEVMEESASWMCRDPHDGCMRFHLSSAQGDGENQVSLQKRQLRELCLNLQHLKLIDGTALPLPWVCGPIDAGDPDASCAQPHIASSPKALAQLCKHYRAGKHQAHLVHWKGDTVWSQQMGSIRFAYCDDREMMC
jgi:hypothetical protein